MRDFFIRALEILVNILVVLMAVGIVAAGVGAMFNGEALQVQTGMPGVLVGAMILLGGAVYLVLIAGVLYLGLGIYQNTRRTAELLAELAK